jgi:predicted ArsR family transcriptional regulator
MNANISISDRCLEILKHEQLTADEVAEKIGESVLAVRPSICILYKEGYVIKTGDKKANASGKPANIWAVSASMRADTNTVAPSHSFLVVKQDKRLVNEAVESVKALRDMGWEPERMICEIKTWEPAVVEAAIKKVFNV